jgi:hypothetical protein
MRRFELAKPFLVRRGACFGHGTYMTFGFGVGLRSSSAGNGGCGAHLGRFPGAALRREIADLLTRRGVDDLHEVPTTCDDLEELDAVIHLLRFVDLPDVASAKAIGDGRVATLIQVEANRPRHWPS